MAEAAGAVLGVDFGTSFTMAALRLPGIPAELVRFGADLRLPSAVMLGEDEELHVGPHLIQESLEAPGQMERAPKRYLGREFIMLGGRLVRDVDLVATVLTYVSDLVRRMLDGRDPETVRLTHPVGWEDTRKQLLRDAAEAAGWPEVELVAEPIAAALALVERNVLTEVPVDGLVAVYDLGGGTFDTVLLRRTERSFEVFGVPGGDEHLGGEDLDDRLVERLADGLPDDERAFLVNPEESPDAPRWERAALEFRLEVRRAKEALAELPKASLRLHPPVSIDQLQLTRGELDSTATKLIVDSSDLLEVTLGRNGKTVDDMAAICLVGGSSRLAVASRILGQRFGRHLATHGDPKSLTALGATSAALDRTAAFPATTADDDESPADAPESSIPLVVPAASVAAEAAAVPQEAAASAPASAEVEAPAPADAPAASPTANATPSAPPTPDADASAPPVPAAAPAPAGSPAPAPTEAGAVAVGADPDADFAQAEELDLVVAVRHEGAEVKHVTIQRSGRLFASVARDHTARIWDAHSGEQLQVLRHGRFAQITATAFTPDGEHLLTVGSDDRGYLWEVSSGRRDRTPLVKHDKAILGAQFSPDGERLATHAEDGTVRIWHVASRAEIARLTFDPKAGSVGVSPNWDYCALPTRKRYVSIRRFAGAEIFGIDLEKRGASLNATSPDGRLLAVAEERSGLIRILGGADGVEVSRSTHPGIQAVAFSPGGACLASVGGSLLRIWRTDDGSRLAETTHAGTVNAVAFAEDAGLLVTGGDDHTARVWAPSRSR